jgi:hypothetical protein
MAVWQRVRSVLFVLGLVVGVGALGGFAWLTQNPTAPIVEEATEWPVVGPLAVSFRQAYVGEPQPPAEVAEVEEPAEGDRPVNEPAAFASRVAGRHQQAAGAPDSAEAGEPGDSPEETLVPFPPEVIEAVEAMERVERGAAPPSLELVDLPQIPSRPSTIPALEWKWFLPGQPLAERPGGEVLADLPALAYLPVLVRQRGWLEVQFDGRRWWLDPSWEPAHPHRGARQGGMRQRREPTRSADWRRLDKAKEMLGLRKPNGRLGPFELWTDVTDAELLRFLDQLAEVVEPAYFARYGRLPSGKPRHAAVLFRSEEDYRSYSPESILSEVHTGHAGSGVLAFFAGNRSRIDLARTLAHEMTHLLNSRALAVVLPQWLEEGLADDLGAVWVESAEADGRGGLDLRSHTDTSRAFVALQPDLDTLRLASTLAEGKLPDIGVFLTLAPEDFYKTSNLSLSYAWGAAFVRYLHSGQGGRHRRHWQAYLGAIAAGYDPTIGEFLEHFEITDAAGLEALEQGFREWLRQEQVAAKARVERHSGVNVVQ